MSDWNTVTLADMKKKVLGLIEELNPDSELLTDDPDISAKIHDVINQVLFELARFKKIPRYVELAVEAGQTVTFEDIGKAAGGQIYQLGNVTGTSYLPRASGTVLKVQESGTLEIDCFLYPERITEDTDGGYVFALSDDALEVMPYGVAGDLLKSDVSAEYGKMYAERYEAMLQRLDSRYGTGCIRVEGGYDI